MTEIPRDFDGYIYHITNEYNIAFPYPINVLTHMFFSIGDGYEYKDNQIVVDIDYDVVTDEVVYRDLLSYAKPDRPYNYFVDELCSQLYRLREDYNKKYEKWFANQDSNPNITLLRIGNISYPYNKIFDLDKNTKPWLLQLAINTVGAWMCFLSDEIKNENYRNALWSTKTETVGTYFQLDMLYDKLMYDLYYTDEDAIKRVKNSDIKL